MLTCISTWTDHLKFAKRVFFKKKSVIFQQGDIGGGFYYIEKGIVKIISDHSGEGRRILDIVGPGYLTGEHSIDGSPYFSTGVCHKDCVLYYFSKNDYQTLIEKHPEVTTLFAQSLIQKERLLLNNINATSGIPKHQIAHSLLYLMIPFQGNEIDLTQQELSQYVGLTRITIYKILKKWSSEGILFTKGRKIYIENPSALREKLKLT